jgi:hypothetical protein
MEEAAQATYRGLSDERPVRDPGQADHLQMDRADPDDNGHCTSHLAPRNLFSVPPRLCFAVPTVVS